MGILDFLGGGQDRRRALDEAASELMYYIPPHLRDAFGLVAEMNPVQGIGAAMGGARTSADPSYSPEQRRQGLLDAALGTGIAAVPTALAARGYAAPAAAVIESFLGGSPASMQLQEDAGRLAADAIGAGRSIASGDLGLLGEVLQPGREARSLSAADGSAHNGGPASSLLSVDMPAHSRPEWSGAAPNRTTPYPRYRPKNTTERMQRLEAQVADPNNPIRDIFRNYIEKGVTLRGPDWYNTEELRQWFVDSLGETEGDRQWREYMELIGTTSTGAKVPSNIRMASFYRAIEDPQDRAAVAALVNAEGITPKAAAERLGVLPANTPENYAYGHIKQRNQASNVVNREEGRWAREIPEGLTGAALSKWLQANPKVKGFGNDLLGDDTNIAADMHFMRMLAMADGGGDFLNSQAKLSQEDYAKAAQVIGPKNIKKYTSTRMVNGKPVSEVNLFKAWQDGKIKDTTPFKSTPTAWADTPKANEYAAYEDMAGRVAAEYEMTPAQFQASLWMGAGDLTGLADESQGTFMELFRRSLDKRAEERGLSRSDMLREFLYNRAPLAVLPAAPVAGLLSRDDEDASLSPYGGI